MRRYLLIPAMIPVMLILWKLVLSADCLHAWQYDPNVDPPTQSDHSFAALAFLTALLTPLIIGLIAAIIAYLKKCRPCWPVLGTVIVASVYLMFILGTVFINFLVISENMAVIGIVAASCLMGGFVVVELINLGACVRHRHWGKFANSLAVCIGAMLYLFWLYAFVIYIDT